MRKGEAESRNADLGPGEGGFPCGDLWRPPYNQSSLGRKKRDARTKAQALFYFIFQLQCTVNILLYDFQAYSVVV